MKNLKAIPTIALSLVMTLISISAHADDKDRWLYIGSKYSGVGTGLDGFVIDGHGDFQGAKKGWKQQDAGNGETLYSGQVQGLLGQQVDVQQSGEGGTLHVNSIISVVPKDGITGATKQNFGDGTKYIAVVNYTDKMKIQNQTECINGQCSTVTPAFCNDFLKASKLTSFKELQKSMSNCDNVISSLGIAGQENKADGAELAQVYNKNIEALKTSKIGTSKFSQYNSLFSKPTGLEQYKPSSLEKNYDQFRLYVNSCLAIDEFNNGAAVGIPVGPPPANSAAPPGTTDAPRSSRARKAAK